MKSFKRSRRVADLLLRDVAEILSSELVDKNFGLVSFTEAIVSDDLRHATVYFSTLADDDRRKALGEYLTANRGRVRSALARRMTTKVTPEILFAHDPSAERGIRMERLFDDISRERREGEK